MSRINPTDNVGQVIAVLGEKQPLALIALQAAHTLGSRIDPTVGENAGLNAMQTLDELGIYGADLARLFTGACKMNPTSLLALCRGVQLGVVEKADLVALSRGDKPAAVNVAQVLARVQEQVPSFGHCHECQGVPSGQQTGECGVF